MDIRDTRKCNRLNLGALARYLEVPADTLNGYYDELLQDRAFLAALNQRIAAVRRTHGFTKAIFQRPRLPSLDWFAFARVLLYGLVRHYRPRWVLETGVYYGGNTAFLLQALARNDFGQLVSIDWPDTQIRQQTTHPRHPFVADSELYTDALAPGFLVPEPLRARWRLLLGDSLTILPTLTETFDLYIHDSDHSLAFVRSELAAVWPKLSPPALLVVDDIDWSNAFFEFCVRRRLHPLLLTDNGKDDLRVRTGPIARQHPRHQVAEITGYDPDQEPDGRPG